MPTLNDTLKVLRRRARRPEQVELYEALDEHYKNEVARTLAQLRGARKLSQEELGRRAGVQQAEVSRILSAAVILG